MRATHHFHRGLFNTKTQKEKGNSEKHEGNIFGVFGFYEKKSNLKKRGKTKTRKLFTRESSQQVEEEQGNLFGFSLILPI
jgi:hypothetical protein